MNPYRGLSNVRPVAHPQLTCSKLTSRAASFQWGLALPVARRAFGGDALFAIFVFVLTRGALDKCASKPLHKIAEATPDEQTAAESHPKDGWGHRALRQVEHREQITPRDDHAERYKSSKQSPFWEW